MSRTLAQAVHDLAAVQASLPAQVDLVTKQADAVAARVRSIDAAALALGEYMGKYGQQTEAAALAGQAAFADRTAVFEGVAARVQQMVNDARPRFVSDLEGFISLEDRHVGLNRSFIETETSSTRLLKQAGDDVADKSLQYGSALRKNAAAFTDMASSTLTSLHDLQNSSQASLREGIRDIDDFADGVTGFGVGTADALSSFNRGTRSVLQGFTASVQMSMTSAVTDPVIALAAQAKQVVTDSVKGGIDSLVSDFAQRGLGAITAAIGSADEKSVAMGRRILQFPARVEHAVKGMCEFLAQAADVLRKLGKAFVHRLEGFVDQFCDQVKSKFHVDLPDIEIDAGWLGTYTIPNPLSAAANAFIDGVVETLRHFVKDSLAMLENSMDIITDVFLLQVHMAMGDAGKVKEDIQHIMADLLKTLKDGINSLIPGFLRKVISL